MLTKALKQAFAEFASEKTITIISGGKAEKATISEALKLFYRLQNASNKAFRKVSIAQESRDEIAKRLCEKMEKFGGSRFFRNAQEYEEATKPEHEELKKAKAEIEAAEFDRFVARENAVRVAYAALDALSAFASLHKDELSEKRGLESLCEAFGEISEESSPLPWQMNEMTGKRYKYNALACWPKDGYIESSWEGQRFYCLIREDLASLEASATLITAAQVRRAQKANAEALKKINAIQSAAAEKVRGIMGEHTHESNKLRKVLVADPGTVR